MGMYEKESKYIVRVVRRRAGFWMDWNSYLELVKEIGGYIYHIANSELNQAGLTESDW